LDREHGTLAEQLARVESRRMSAGGDDKKEKEVAVENYGPMYRYVL